MSVLRSAIACAAAGAMALTAAAPAAAQIRPNRPGVTIGTPPVAQIVDTYDVEIRDGQSGQLSMSRVQSGSAEISGSIFGDPITGFLDAGSGQAVFIRFSAGRAVQVFVMSRAAGANGWTGVMHALSAGAGASAARNSYAFRATGRALALSSPPALPAHPAGVTNPLVFSGAAERWFPLQSTPSSPGVLRISFASNGAVSGHLGPMTQIGLSSRPTLAVSDSITGHYAAGAGTLVIVRYALFARSVPSSRPVEVLTATLAADRRIAGERHSLVSLGSGVPALGRAWSAGRGHLLNAVIRRGECFAAENGSTAAGARLRVSACSAGSRELEWGFVNPAPGARSQPAYRLVSLRSGLCAAAPSGGSGQFTQEACTGSPPRQNTNINAVLSSDGDFPELVELIPAGDVGGYPAVFFTYDAPQTGSFIPDYCPGVTRNDSAITNNCNPNNAYWLVQ